MRALIAVDGSAVAEQAAVVADQILPTGAELILLDVVELTSPVLLGADGTGALYAGQMLRDMERRGTARATQEVESVAERLGDRDPEPVVDHGLVVERVIDVADERDVDLIVLGTGDHSWWDRLWHGSVSRRVATEASRPVLVVRSAAPIRTVMVAVDDSDPAETAAAVVGQLDVGDAEIVVVTVVAGDARDREPGEPGPPEAYELVSEIGEEIGAGGYTVTVDDAPIDALIAAAERHKADLIVVGTGDRGFVSRLFDESVSRGVLDRAPCSVLVAREISRPPAAANGPGTRSDQEDG